MKVTVDIVREMKRAGRRVAVLTAYDYPMARLLDEAEIPVLLVGDSLGMVVLGHPDTTHVTLSDMEHHVRAVARAKPSALVVADLPYRSYETAEAAVRSAGRLVEAGADAVKAEGGRAILDAVRAIVGAGIPFMGHLGMLPQHVLEEGGYRIKGRDEGQRRMLLEEASLLEEAGAFAIVLELVTPPVAAEMSRGLRIPTIGIGSGPDCDGQVLVTPDLVGGFPWFTPRFVRPRVSVGAEIRETARAWAREVEQGGPSAPAA